MSEGKEVKRMIMVDRKSQDDHIHVKTEGDAVLLGTECLSAVLCVYNTLKKEDVEYAENFRKALADDDFFKISGELEKGSEKDAEREGSVQG